YLVTGIPASSTILRASYSKNLIAARNPTERQPCDTSLSMTRFHVRLGVMALLATFLLASCGETVVDSTKTEEQLQASLSKSLGEKVSSVDCPSNQKVEPGATFTCSVKLSKGKTETVTLKIRNEDADLSVTKITETSQQGQ